MTHKTNDKTRARALQEETGWGYSECLRLVREKTDDEIDVVVAQRKEACAAAFRDASAFGRGVIRVNPDGTTEHVEVGSEDWKRVTKGKVLQ